MPGSLHTAPSVALESQGTTTHAVALELSGHHATVRSARVLPRHAAVCVRLAWPDGARTTLPGVVSSVDGSAGEPVTRVSVSGIEDDWSRFLAYVGPSLSIG